MKRIPTLTDLQCHCPWLALGLSIFIAILTLMLTLLSGV
ncbi:MAG: hypothetical protein FOGNACKC_02490 [Anaerolineae bacterium]|nr:hypothetical protein [Anaerolineae bacterium]